ncbi:hypothetical protein AB1Y20_008937 [Prymnesium parvum]|uniref:Transmembrane protein n=1 Tax=Prymnesium parvum TaxID=97485 RepID=A0AB34K2Q0_PRYPA
MPLRLLRLLALLPMGVSLRVSYNLHTSRRLAALQDFGSRGGLVSTDLKLSIGECSNSTPSACSWAEVKHVYLVLLSTDQLHDIIRRRDFLGSTDCQHPSMARTALSLLRWQEARERTADGRALLRFGGDDVALERATAASTRFDVVDPAELRFRIQYRLPKRADLHTLALLNCETNSIKLEGESSFEGENGEKLSLPHLDLMRARITIAIITFLAAVGMAKLCVARRAITVPLQWLLVFALVARHVRQLLLLVPIFAASRDELLPRALSAPLEVIDTWEPVLASSLLAEAASLLASLAFLCAMLGLAAGRHFTSPVLPPREQEVLVGSMSMYFVFGMLQAACTNEVSCGVFVLSFQVLRLLLIFSIVLFINASIDRLRRETGHRWEVLFPELLRLTVLLAVRRRIILVHLILPILFMFLEVQVLGWQAIWFKDMWRECIELYLVLAVAWRIMPSSLTYIAHFRWVRPSPNSLVSSSTYARFFRFILGSSLDAARADATLLADSTLLAASGQVPLRLNDSPD